jgi:hypothetical protein
MVMDIVTDYWVTVDYELVKMGTRVRGLRDDHMLQMRIKDLVRDWKTVEQDYKLYINAVRAILHEQVRYLLVFSSTHS